MPFLHNPSPLLPKAARQLQTRFRFYKISMAHSAADHQAPQLHFYLSGNFSRFLFNRKNLCSVLNPGNSPETLPLTLQGVIWFRKHSLGEEYIQPKLPIGKREQIPVCIKLSGRYGPNVSCSPMWCIFGSMVPGSVWESNPIFRF